jgi:hypothetical protein
MNTPPFKYEEKVIIQVPGEKIKREKARSSEPTIVNMPAVQSRNKALDTAKKTKVAVGVILGAMAITSGVILATKNIGSSKEKHEEANASAATADTAATINPSPVSALVTSAPKAPTAQISSEPAPAPTVTSTSTAAPVAPDDSTKPLEDGPIVSAVPVYTANPTAMPKIKSSRKSEIMHEVPF